MSRYLVAGILTIAVALFCAPSKASDYVTFDGVWWQELTRPERLAAVQGMLDASDAGFTSGWSAGYAFAVKMPGLHIDTRTNIGQELKRYQNGLGAAGPRFSKKFGDYIDDVTTFYDAHPKRIGLRVADILLVCFADKPTVDDCDQFGSADDNK